MPKKKLIADVDAFYKGQAYGNVAQKLLANGMSVNALRTNSTLRSDEWKHLDETVVEIARNRLVGVNDLVSRGLTYNIPNGLGKTVLEYEDISDMSDAEVNIDASTRQGNDRVAFSIGYLPLPVIHKSFQISARVLEASRTMGQPLDSVQAAVASRKVAEMAETILFTGGSNLTFGGGTIYGYEDFPNRNTETLVTQWTASAATAAVIRDDVLAMKQASIDAKHFGPWILYVPTGYETVLDEDFSTSYSNNTIRDRLLKIGGIVDVKVSDYLTAHNVVLVELSPETVRMVIGLQPTTVEWSAEGGLIFLFKVMTIMVPQLRADQDGNCGIVHLAA
jgi:uncharacterized linocin/CFP29 family protein